MLNVKTVLESLLDLFIFFPAIMTTKAAAQITAEEGD